jgi:hypothetical protein
MSETKCPICDLDLNDRHDDPGRYVTHYDCPQCGKFDTVGIDFKQFLLPALERDPLLRKRITRYLYENRSGGGRTLLTAMKAEEGAHKEYQRVLTLDEAEDLYKTDLSPLEKYQQTLLNFANLSSRIGDQVNLVSNRYAVPTFDEEERKSICDALAEEGLITMTTVKEGRRVTINGAVALTHKGWAKASELRRTTSAEPIVFIAAWFNESTKEARDAIEGVVGELGYTPRSVDKTPHNDQIEVQIYDLIRRSTFMVADLTGNRQSVYYEIGFAHGLGRQVVLTCRKDFFDSHDDEWKRFESQENSCLERRG